MSEGTWVSAAEALLLYARVVPSKPWRGAQAITRFAHNGVVRSRARVFIRRDRNRPEQRFEHYELPTVFWWAEDNPALEADWEIGTFITWVNNNNDKWTAIGVEFHSGDLVSSLPLGNITDSVEHHESSSVESFSDDERRQWIQNQTERNGDKAYKIYRSEERFDGTKQDAFRMEWRELKGRGRGRPRGK